jgi:serine phosphatase RsbU (regulator of sigma subunit)
LIQSTPFHVSLQSGSEALLPSFGLTGGNHQTAAEIFDAIRADLLDFSRPADDITLVAIKRM